MISSMTPAAVFMGLTISVSFFKFSASVFLSNFATLSELSLRSALFLRSCAADGLLVFFVVVGVA